MADTTYFNPQTVNPGTGYKPEGFLGGYTWGEDRQRYNQLAPLQDLMSMMAAQAEIDKQKEYGLNEPVRSAKRLENVATSKALAATVGGQKQGVLDELTLKNELSRKTQSAKISEVLLENAKKEREGAMEKLQTGFAIASILAQAAGNGPAATAAVAQRMKEAGFDLDNDLLAKTILQDPSKAKVIADAFDQASQQYRLELMKQREHAAGTLATAKEHSRGQMGAAAISATAKTKDFETELRSQLMKGTDENKLAIAAGAERDPELNPRLKEFARAVGEQALRNLAVKNGLKDFDIGKPTESLMEKVQRMQRVLSGGGPAPTNSGTNTGIPGVTRLP